MSRAYASLVHLYSADAGDDVWVRTGEDGARLPLPGGWVTTWGAEPHRVMRATEMLGSSAGVRVTA